MKDALRLRGKMQDRSQVILVRRYLKQPLPMALAQLIRQIQRNRLRRMRLRRSVPEATWMRSCWSVHKRPERKSRLKNDRSNLQLISYKVWRTRRMLPTRLHTKDPVKRHCCKSPLIIPFWYITHRSRTVTLVKLPANSKPHFLISVLRGSKAERRSRLDRQPLKLEGSE